ncbi:hypothetical protein [Clostridium botulinum]|uniref:hypothetical protein n=1 Tax=Clostridium botulinum TaxID=1491 RepID=UPI0006A6B321|nr:hypothetical protein [Clostridium botulinum]KAI3350116.1 hypothetical protein CIT18_04365 [Clostridium botulinum]KOM88936.1 hypothetical protein ACP51_04155 [Clostridium botulinum]KOR63502.1 hypothetical protein ADT22_02940 [Clostridium botulinum]MCS6111514.1 hypothetical protein [Clostridium botulinum]NFE10934.1 hypothetical protein [Clostridium botulinum]
MKFNIMGFNQIKLYDEYLNLNCNDVVVLRTLIDIIPKMEVKVEKDNKEFSWVMYKLLVDDLPFITRSESTMKKIVQKLIDAGLIERLVVNRGGKYTYFRKTDKCIELEYTSESTDKKDEQKKFNDEEKNKIEKVKGVLTEKISNITIDQVLKSDDEILHGAVEACNNKKLVTNSYFINSIGLAKEHRREPYTKKNNLRFMNFEPRKYDYDKLERKLLGWEDEHEELDHIEV